jgi:hypothetical protein
MCGSEPIIDNNRVITLPTQSQHQENNMDNNRPSTCRCAPPSWQRSWPGCLRQPGKDPGHGRRRGVAQRGRERGAAGAPELAPAEINAAREKMMRANQALAAKDYKLARELAVQAQADAKLAQSKANSAKATAAADALNEDLRVLRQEVDRANAPVANNCSSSEQQQPRLTGLRKKDPP